MSEPTIAEIQSAVAAAFGVSVHNLTGHRRYQGIAKPRQAGYLLAYEMTGKTLPQIGRAFGGRDHSTIMHGIKEAAAERERDPCFANLVEEARLCLRKKVYR